MQPGQIQLFIDILQSLTLFVRFVRAAMFWGYMGLTIGLGPVAFAIWSGGQLTDNNMLVNIGLFLRDVDVFMALAAMILIIGLPMGEIIVDTSVMLRLFLPRFWNRKS